jgi:hypothetical protein
MANMNINRSGGPAEMSDNPTPGDRMQYTNRQLEYRQRCHPHPTGGS